ncbi:YrdC domain-containing protein, mitochondrial [Trichinella pseudospiralis]|uniref:Threonylcarbamoyl-AMP synthase n=1 Tax=Trichinella pseudospiralis TaxID=6337 RepID=A0A0V1FZC3_TRIPS|nr:YrdC domain-containing protein, mitochondrial [Trichinella pseudospiralis]
MSTLRILQCSATTLTNCVQEATECILKGGIVAIPTDTVYGLTSSLFSIHKLYEVKRRQPNKPIAFCLADVSDIALYADVDIPAELLNRLLPGPVTVLFRQADHLPLLVNHSVVGFRVINHNFVMKLCQQVGQPLPLTSANIANERSCLEVSEFKSIHPNLSLIVDAGKISSSDPRSRIGSTVVDFSLPGTFKIVREGQALQHCLSVLTDSVYGLQQR